VARQRKGQNHTPSSIDYTAQVGACGKPRVVPYNQRPRAGGSYQRSEFAAVLPWHEGRPEARRPDRARHPPNLGNRERTTSDVYLTSSLDAAAWEAELTPDEGPSRIYIMEPTGPIEDDPNLTDKKYRGATKSCRSGDRVSMRRRRPTGRHDRGRNEMRACQSRGSTEPVMPQAQPATAVRRSTATLEASR
jgi:hypothetical protein